MTAFSRATDSGTSSTTRRRNRHVAQVEELVAVQVGHRLHDLLARGVALLDEDLVDLAAVVLGDGLRLGQLLLADDASPDQKIAQVCHGRTASMRSVPEWSERLSELPRGHERSATNPQIGSDLARRMTTGTAPPQNALEKR